MAKDKFKLSKAEEHEISEHVKDLKERLVSKFGTSKKRLEDVDDHRWKRNTVRIPDAYAANITPYHSPLIFDYCRRVPAIFGNAIPQVKVSPARPGARAQEDSSESENFWNGFIERLIQERDITAQLRDALPNTGGAVWKCILKRDDWFSPPGRDDGEDEIGYNKRIKEWRKGIFPFTWDFVPMDTYYPHRVNRQLIEAMEITKREAYDISKKYNLTRDGNGELRNIGDRTGVNGGQAVTGECEFWEWCDKTRYAYFVDGEMVKAGRHNYGAVYYFDAPAAPSASTRPEDEWLPFAWPLVSMQDELETAVTMYKNWVYMNTYPTPVIFPTSPESIDTYDKNETITLVPGEGFKPHVGYDIKYLTAPLVHGDLKSYLDRMDREAEMLALAAILQGTGPGAGTPGVTAAMQLTVAHSMFDPAGVSYAHAWDRFYEFVMRVIDTVLIDPVAIFYNGEKWVERGADDIKGYYLAHHSMKPVIPAETQLELNMDLQLYDRDLIPPTQVLETSGRHAPEEDLREAWVYGKMNKDPRVDDKIMEMVFRQIDPQPPQSPEATADTTINALGTPANPPAGNSGMGIIPQGNPQGPMGTASPLETTQPEGVI